MNARVEIFDEDDGCKNLCKEKNGFQSKQIKIKLKSN